MHETGSGNIPTRPTLSRTSTKEKFQKTSTKYLRVLRILFLDPLKIILYLRFPAVFLTVYYAAVTFGSLYVLNISIQYTFARQPYEFSVLILGLLYLPNSLGYVLASIYGGRWMDNIMKREALRANRVAEDGKLIYRPEDRMRENAWLGAILYPAALIWYGWTAEKGVYFIVPVSQSRLPWAPARSIWLTVLPADDCQLLLRGWLNANFCDGHDDVDGVHATKIFIRRCSKQPG